MPTPRNRDQSAPAAVDAGGTGEYLTTAQGLRLPDTDHSLKAGARGPTLLEDFHLREKITHFDHERIPERMVHARGSAPHGFFECTKAYRHAKSILALDEGLQLLEACGISPTLPGGEPDPGLIATSSDARTTTDACVAAIAKHRHFARETDPPRV